jgi:uncharacterized protein YlaI
LYHGNAELATQYITVSLITISQAKTAKRKGTLPGSGKKKAKHSEDEEPRILQAVDNICDDDIKTPITYQPIKVMMCQHREESFDIKTTLPNQAVNPSFLDAVSQRMVIENQALQLQTRLLTQVYKPLLNEAHCKHNIANKFKEKMNQFGLLLETMSNDDKLFEAET